MNKTTFFKMVSAPLKNTRWSWGAVRADGKVVLAVWAKDIHNGTVVVKGINDYGPGAAERRAHLEVATGVFCVVCQGDHKVGIQSLDHRQLWFVNDFTTDEQGNTYGKLSHRVAVGELLA